MFDSVEFSRFLELACGHYEKSAPTVADWIDCLYRRIGSDPSQVCLSEILFAQRLQENGEWMLPNYAANGLIHLFQRIGRETTGMIDH